MKRYMAADWWHDSDTEPVRLYSEISATDWELRKVEIYRDGRMDFANAAVSTGQTELGIVEVPGLDEINAQAEFSARPVSREEFETMWERARAQHDVD